MSGRHACQARQYGDQMICAPCGLTWDTNDPEPPECRKNIKRATARVAKFEAEAAPKPPTGLPDELPPDLGAEMERTYRANIRGGDLAGRIRGMQAAYRVLLDMLDP